MDEFFYRKGKIFRYYSIHNTCFCEILNTLVRGIVSIMICHGIMADLEHPRPQIFYAGPFTTEIESFTITKYPDVYIVAKILCQRFIRNSFGYVFSDRILVGQPEAGGF